jgi:tRNA (Thr-GGU) A37 N-methylase
MMEINLQPVAWVKNSRLQPMDDHWGNIISEIILDDVMPDDVFSHITDFSHLEIIYFFDKVPDQNIDYSRRP